MRATKTGCVILANPLGAFREARLCTSSNPASGQLSALGVRPWRPEHRNRQLPTIQERSLRSCAPALACRCLVSGFSGPLTPRGPFLRSSPRAASSSNSPNHYSALLHDVGRRHLRPAHFLSSSRHDIVSRFEVEEESLVVKYIALAFQPRLKTHCYVLLNVLSQNPNSYLLIWLPY